MNPESGTTRWWEYYAVRYLMPSIAGMAIVNWLCFCAGDGLRSLLSLPANSKSLDSSSLILLFLYGNLFCYVASYPVLVFHVTRVLDFRDGEWPAYPFVDGYIVTIVLAPAIALIRFFPAECRYLVAFLVAIILSIVQLIRLWLVLARPFKVRGHGDLFSSAYFYSYVLAHRRGLPAVEEKEVQKSGAQNSDGTSEELPSDEEEKQEEVTSTRSRTNLWRKEFMDTYRHLREHGNSAFIFLLELVLAALVYSTVTRPRQSPAQELGAIGLLFGIWAMPSLFVHLLGQHLERRFSQYEQRLRSEVERR